MLGLFKNGFPFQVQPQGQDILNLTFVSLEELPTLYKEYLLSLPSLNIAVLLFYMSDVTIVSVKVLLGEEIQLIRAE